MIDVELERLAFMARQLTVTMKVMLRADPALKGAAAFFCLQVQAAKRTIDKNWDELPTEVQHRIDRDLREIVEAFEDMGFLDPGSLRAELDAQR